MLADPTDAAQMTARPRNRCTDRGRSRIGFLFNHDAVHQVAHGLPIALSLSKLRPDIEVAVFHTTDALAAEIDRLARSVPDHRCTFRRLDVGDATRWLDAAVGRIAPIRRIGVLRDNLGLFQELDALVVPEKTSLLLKSWFGLKDLNLVHTRHGAGDRAIGFDKASAKFDHILVSGPKIRDRLKNAGRLAETTCSIVGYPKFDLFLDKPPRRLFDNDRPTVLYNPHCSPYLSSWRRFGRQVLDFFYENQDYNLVFAPHVMLFRKKLHISIERLSISTPGTIDPKYFARPNILIDTDSAALTDMTYTMAADLYLGDVSSQIYEFMARPRPCMFLNAHSVEWRGDSNFTHWQAGPVVDDMSDFRRHLETAIRSHPDYLGVQRDLFAYTFDLNGIRSSDRAAAAIAERLLQGDRRAAVQREAKVSGRPGITTSPTRPVRKPAAGPVGARPHAA